MALPFDLASARRTRGWSQADLARASRISLRQIKNLEQGAVRRPHPHTLAALAEALEVVPADLSTLTDAQLQATIAKADAGGASADGLLFEAMLEQFCRQVTGINPAAAYVLVGREATAMGFDSCVQAVLDVQGSLLTIEQQAIDQDTSGIASLLNGWCGFFDAHTSEWPDTHIHLQARSVISIDDIPDAGDGALDRFIC
jgi:transcriptional regulator with XRE-family HTH domain